MAAAADAAVLQHERAVAPDIDPATRTFAACSTAGACEGLDTDGDGCSDGHEDADLVPDALACDADGDGVPDSVETGVSVPMADTDLAPVAGWPTPTRRGGPTAGRGTPMAAGCRTAELGFCIVTASSPFGGGEGPTGPR